MTYVAQPGADPRPDRQGQALGRDLRRGWASSRLASDSSPFVALFVDMLIDGWARLRPNSSRSSRRAAPGRRESSRLGRNDIGDAGHRGGGGAAGRGGASTSRSMREELGHRHHRDQHHQSRRRHVDRLRPAGARAFCVRVRARQSIQTAGLTLALLILPVVIVATREAIRADPGMIREGAYAVGATKWQTTRTTSFPTRCRHPDRGHHRMSRAIGETAPIITIGALTFIAFLPPSPVGTDFPFLELRVAERPRSR